MELLLKVVQETISIITYVEQDKTTHIVMKDMKL